MSGEVIKTQNGQTVEPQASATLEAWREFSIREIQLTEQLSVKVKPMDVIAWLSRGEENPLLATVVQSTQQGTDGVEAGANLMSDQERMGKLSKSLDDLMIEVMVSPPLIEQGHEHGIPVSKITFGQKMVIFKGLVDEEQLDQLSKFRGGQSSAVVSRSKGKTVRKKPK